MKQDLKEKAIEMRQQGISIIKISQSLGVAKSSVSVWTRPVILTEKQKQTLLSRPLNLRGISNSNTFRRRREKYQEQGRQKIKSGEALFVAGCMLYWGEGTKNVNRCELVNSELPMLLVFKNFLLTYFDLSEDNLNISINAYTDLHSKEEIEKYWIEGLGLLDSNLKYTLWNQYPVSSKRTKKRKSEYGTCTLTVCKTEIVQEIFGAIQEFGSFENEKWLS